MKSCEVAWCSEPECAPSGRCRVHMEDIPDGDPRLGPVLTFCSKTITFPQAAEDSGRFFFLEHSRDGRFCQVSEVLQRVHGPEVPIESTVKIETA